MPKAKSKTKPKRQRVTFSLDAPGARKAMLMGDFNDWNPKAHPMKEDVSGVWKKIVMLAPGRYEYKFLVDGQWRNDSKNNQICTNCFGTQNNVLTIS